MNKHVILFALVLNLLAAFLCNCFGETLIMEPPLRDVFPLDQKLEGVRLKFPVLINDNSVAGTDVILHSIYNSTGDGTGRTDSTQTDWSKVDLFLNALGHVVKGGTNIVYSYDSNPKSITSIFNPPEGMFLGQTKGNVEVLSLVKNSRAALNGVKVGDQIRSVQGTIPVTSLQTFMVAYLTTRQSVQLSGALSYTIEVWRPSDSSEVTIQMVTHNSSSPFPRFN